MRCEMKKQMKKIICFALLVVAYGCSYGQHIVDKEISPDELMKLEGKPAVLKVHTKDTLFNNISSWDIRDSSLAFPDYGKNYAEKISKYRVNRLGDLGKQKNREVQKYYKYPKPDTLLIPFKSINKIEYSLDEGQNGSDNSGTPSRFGGEVNWRNGEFTVAILNQVQIGIYRMVVKVNTTFLPEGGETRISSSGLYTLGYMLAAGLVMGTIHQEDVGEKGQNVYALILGSPLLLTNAEHHLFIVNAPGNYQSDPFSLSSFAAFRTDYFGPEWIVYSAGLGLQFEFNSENEDGNSFGSSRALKAGYEFTYDGKKGDFWTSIPFLALEITF